MSPRLIPVVFNQVALLVFGLIGVRLLTTTMDEGVLGPYLTWFITLGQVGLLVTHPGIVNHASRYWQRERPQGAAYLRFLCQAGLRQARYLWLILGAVTLVLAFWQRQFEWLLVLPLLFVASFAFAAASTASLILNAEERHWAVMLLGSAGAAARALLPVGIVLCFQPRLLGLAGGFALASVFVLWLIWGLFRWARAGEVAPPEVQRQWQEELREYGRPFIILGVGSWLLQYADRGVVMLFFGEKQAALFSLASMLSSYVPNLVMATLMQVVFPRIFRRADQAGTPAAWGAIARDCDRANWAFIGLASAGILLLAWQGHILVESVIGAKYRPAMHLVFPAGMAILASQANQFQFLLLQGQHNSQGMVKVTIVLAVIKTLGSLVAAAISWRALEIWLIASMFICALLGRQMIRHFAFNRRPVVA